MRSGLENPGAIPLLAVLVAGLLSITPILCTKPEDAGHSMKSDNSVPTICQHIPSLSTGSDLPMINNIDTLWQQVRRVATTFVLSSSTSSKQQDKYAVHKLARGRDDLDEILDPPRQRNYNDNTNNNNNNSVEHQPIVDSTSITISLASLPNVPANKNNQSSPSSSSSSSPPSPTLSIERPSTPQTQNTLNNASNPVDRKGSYMAILISLVVAIMWL